MKYGGDSRAGAADAKYCRVVGCGLLPPASLPLSSNHILPSLGPCATQFFRVSGENLLRLEDLDTSHFYFERTITKSKDAHWYTYA
jgi:hypothetical protein